MCPGGVSFRFGGEVEAYLGEVALRHLQDIVAVGEEHVAAVLVGSHELVFALLEGCESFRVVALDPACLCRGLSAPTGIARRIRAEDGIVSPRTGAGRRCR